MKASGKKIINIRNLKGYCEVDSHNITLYILAKRLRQNAIAVRNVYIREISQRPKVKTI